jgi:hypothetical protein
LLIRPAYATLALLTRRGNSIACSIRTEALSSSRRRVCIVLSDVKPIFGGCRWPHKQQALGAHLARL